MNLDGAKYRITYEAFSKFSGNLGKVDSLEALGHLTQKHLKYLFNFKGFQISIVDDFSTNCYSFGKGKQWKFSVDVKLNDFEKELLDKQIPVVHKSDNLELPKHFSDIPATNGKLWGWYLDYNNYKVCILLLSDDTTPFSYNDVEIVHLLVSSLTSKYKQLILSDQLQAKNKNLEFAITQVELKNAEIKKINDNQKYVIEERTRELREKNEKLIELSRLNAHNLREPLSRILGLLEIVEFYDEEELHTIVFPSIKSSSKDLDEIIKEVVRKSDEEILNSNQNKNFE